MTPPAPPSKFFFILFLVFCFLFLPIPAEAAFWDFLFPPVQMQPSTRTAPGPALAPEVPSNNTYSNTLKDNTVECNSQAVLRKSWEPVTETVTATDSSGKIIQKEEFVDYEARDLEATMDVKNLSNEYYRNFQSFFARGAIKCTPEAAKKQFLGLNMDGSSSSLRAVPYQKILYYRSQFLKKVALSLNNSTPLDTVVQDYQIAWSCQGTCQEMSELKPNSCRPVYLSELVYGLADKALYYDDPTLPATTFPSDVLSAVSSHYRCGGNFGCYRDRSSGQPFSPLSQDTYELLFDQINFVPKGNADSKVTVTNYGGYDTLNQRPLNPQPTTFHRTLPNAAAATSQEAQSLAYVNPTEQKDLPNADLCANPKLNSSTSRDQPVNNLFTLFVKGLFRVVTAGNSYQHSESLPVATTYDEQVVDNTKVSEKAFSNMIPVQTLKQGGYIEQPFSSITSANQNNPIPDPGYRANELYLKMRSLLRPSSWF